MKYFLIILLYFPSIAQNPPDTEIFLFNIEKKNGIFQVEKGRNISQNPGYDNQPSFYTNDLVIYARTRNGQTDIAGYNLVINEDLWYSNTKQGGEYSPKRIPESTKIAAVRLDTTGLQRLYQYDMETQEGRILIPELKVGYFAFLNENKLITAVLTESRMDLVLNHLNGETSETLASNIGRSLHKVPDTGSISYTVLNEEKNLDLYLMDFKEGEPSSFFVCTLPAGVQDYVWLDQDQILIGNDEKLFFYKVLGHPEWTAVADLSDYNLRNITRIAISEDGNTIALAAESTVSEK